MITIQICYLLHLEVQSPRWAMIRVSAGQHSFLEVVGENLFSCCFQFLEAALILWLMDPSIFQANNNGLGHLTSF
jgi:hypothetical protein